MARDRVVKPPNCTPGARPPLKDEPKAPGDLHQPFTPEGARQTLDAQSGAQRPGLRGVGTLERAPQAQHGCTHHLAGQRGALCARCYELQIKHDPSSSEAASSTGPNKTGHFRNLRRLPTSGNSWLRPGLQRGVGGPGRGGGRGACTAEKGRSPHPQSPSTAPRHRDSPMLLFLRMGTSRLSGPCLAPWPPWALRLVSKGSSAPTGKRDADHPPTPGPLGPAQQHTPLPSSLQRGSLCTHKGGPPDVCRMRLPAAKDVSAAPRGQHGAPDTGACPAPYSKLQNTREGPAASPPGAPPQGSRVRADPGEVPEASPPHPQGRADRPAAACWTAHLGQRAGRQTGPRTRTGCSRNFSTTSASATSSAALTDPILAEHPGLAGASGARPDWASVRPHSSLNISPP